MIDFSALSRSFGLTREQAATAESRLEGLPEQLRANLGQSDFELLMMGQSAPLPLTGSGGPTLSPPAAGGSSDSSQLAGLLSDQGGSATLGGAIMALLTKSAAEQRKANKEVKAAEAESIAKTMEAQAKEMKEKALVQLILGIVSGAITVIGGLVTAGRAGAAMGSNMSAGDAALYNAKIGGQSQAFGGTASMVDSVSQYVGTMYDVEIKKMDAQIERSRANVEALKDFNESLTELIRKCLDTQLTMAENANQARSRILG
jgi:hypothetical protein